MRVEPLAGSVALASAPHPPLEYQCPQLGDSYTLESF